MISAMGGMSCTISWVNPAGACPGMYAFGGCSGAVNLLVMGTGPFTVMARHSPGSPTFPVCMWGFRPSAIPSDDEGLCATNVSVTTTCTIDYHDDGQGGLPVELMEFSVESDSDETGGTETGSSGDPDA